MLVPLIVVERAAIADSLIDGLLLDDGACDERAIVLVALQAFGACAIADCYLRALSQVRTWAILSVDADVHPAPTSRQREF